MTSVALKMHICTRQVFKSFVDTWKLLFRYVTFCAAKQFLCIFDSFHDHILVVLLVLIACFCVPQNPANCSSARKLLCGQRARCGLGCELHHIGVCLFLAIGTNRTMVLDTDMLDFTKRKLQNVYRPLSSTCPHVTKEDLNEAVDIKGNLALDCLFFLLNRSIACRKGDSNMAFVTHLQQAHLQHNTSEFNSNP